MFGQPECGKLWRPATTAAAATTTAAAAAAAVNKYSLSSIIKRLIKAISKGY